MTVHLNAPEYLQGQHDNVPPGQCCHKPEDAVTKEHGWIHEERKRTLRRPGEKNMFLFIYHESHTK
jgi:hypothetical protein